MNTSTKFFLSLTVGVLMLGFATASFAVTPPGLTISDASGNTVTIDQGGNVTFSGSCSNCTTFFNVAQPGYVTWGGRLGSFTIASIVGQSKPLLKGAPWMDLSIQSVTSTTGGTLTVQWTDVNFTTPDLVGMAMHAGGLTAGSITFNSFADNGNVPFGTGVPLGTLGPFTAPPFSGDLLNANHPTSAQYSLTEVVTLQVPPGAGVGGDFELQLTPAPLTLTCPAATTGQVNVAYNSALKAVGGVPPYTFSQTSGSLPPGLTLYPDGTITGIPTAAGNYSFDAQVIDSQNVKQTATVSGCPIDTTPQLFNISGCAYADNNRDMVFDQTPPPADAALPNVQITLKLPSVSTDCTSIPMFTTSMFTDSSGSYQFGGLSAGTYCLSAPNNAGGLVLWTASSLSPSVGPDSQNNCFGYVPGPTATCLVITNAVQGVMLTAGPMAGSGGAGAPYTFTSTDLPAGLTMAADGTISGIPEVSGTFAYHVTVQDKNGNTGTIECSITIAPPPTATCLSINAVAGVPFSAGPMQGSGGTGGPYTFALASGPPWLIVSQNGMVLGTPPAGTSGTINYSVTVTDKDGHTGTINCSVNVNPPPTATCLSINAVAGMPFSAGPMMGSGGTAGPYTFALDSGPSWLTVSPDGHVSGTVPAGVSGDIAYTVKVTDKDGHTGSINCSIHVLPPPPVCALTAKKTCQLPPPPPVPFVCTNAKPIDSLSMIWEGSQGGFGPAHIKAWKNAKLNANGTVNTTGATLLADIDNVAIGQKVTVSGYAVGTAPVNDQYWEIFKAGTTTPLTGSAATSKSTFHISCSDTDMNDPGDCGKLEGDGKNTGSAALNYINLWQFDGMAGKGLVLSCSPTAPPPPEDTCQFTNSIPSCKLNGKPTSLTFKYTGGSCASGNNPQGGKATCTGSVDTGLPITIKATTGTYTGLNTKYTVNGVVGGPTTVNPGDVVIVKASAFDADSYFSLNNSGGTEKLHIHTSCSQPLAVGDVFGNLTLVAFNGEQAGTSVTYNYEVTNLGDAVVNLVGTDDKLGSVFPAQSLAAGQTITAQKVVDSITQTTVNTLTVTADTIGGPSCSTQAQATVEQVEPVLSCADGKPHTLVFEYTGKDCTATTNYQGGKLICSGMSAPLPDGVQLVETDANASKFTISPSSLNVGDLVTVTFTTGAYPAQTPFAIKYNGATVESLSIHTSCSQQLNVGDQFGTLRLVKYIPY